MTRIRFEDLPSTNTPRNAENLNKLNNVVISPTEPTTGEEVWIDDVNKKIYTKNDNGGYENFYDKNNREFYSLGEQVIGTYLGKPLYKNVITGNIDDNTTLVSNVEVLLDAKGSGDINSVYRVIPYYEIYNNLVYTLIVNKNLSNEVKVTILKGGQPTTASNCNIVLKYTKTTD